MSLTFAVDDELGSLLHDEAKRKGLSAPEVAAELLRAALLKPKASVTTVFRVKPHAGAFASGVQLDKLNRMADELEAEAFFDKQRLVLHSLV